MLFAAKTPTALTQGCTLNSLWHLNNLEFMKSLWTVHCLPPLESARDEAIFFHRIPSCLSLAVLWHLTTLSQDFSSRKSCVATLWSISAVAETQHWEINFKKGEKQTSSVSNTKQNEAKQKDSWEVVKGTEARACWVLSQKQNRPCMCLPWGSRNQTLE